MKYALKGITQTSSLQFFTRKEFSQFSFDLRPKSFNFTQHYKIIEMIQNDQSLSEYSLLFENEKDFVVSELFKLIGANHFGAEILCEFCGRTDLDYLESLNIPYVWHFHDGEKIASLAKYERMKRIVFRSEDLKLLLEKGDLFAFLKLFDYLRAKVEIEIQMQWNAELFESLHDHFQIDYLSFEINQMVEKSYQQPNHEMIKEHLKQLALI